MKIVAEQNFNSSSQKDLSFIIRQFGYWLCYDLKLHVHHPLCQIHNWSILIDIRSFKLQKACMEICDMIHCGD